MSHALPASFVLILTPMPRLTSLAVHFGLMSLCLAGQTAVIPIQPGETATGSLESHGGRQAYSFIGNSNDVVTALMSPANHDCRLSLYDPAGFLLAGPNIPQLCPGAGYEAVSLQSFRLVTAGLHRLVCENNNFGTSDPQVYGVTMVRFPGTNITDAFESGVIFPGQTNFSQLNSPADLDVFTFFAVAGDSMTIRMGRSDFNLMHPSFALHGPDGTLLRSVEDLNYAEATLDCVSESGSYFLLCRDQNGCQAGAYWIALEQTPIPPPPGTPPQYLSICHCANQLITRWSTNATGFLLESSSDLLLTNWTMVNPPYPVVSGYYHVTNAPPFSNTFYRLRKQ